VARNVSPDETAPDEPVDRSRRVPARDDVVSGEAPAGCRAVLIEPRQAAVEPGPRRGDLPRRRGSRRCWAARGAVRSPRPAARPH